MQTWINIRSRVYYVLFMKFLCPFLLGLLILRSICLPAAPLTTVPELNRDRLQLSITARSDLWLAPQSDKETPFRLYDIELHAPVVKSPDWSGVVIASTEAVSNGRTDLLIGENQTPLGSLLRTQALGVGITRQGEALSFFSAYAAYKSASDEPFEKSRDTWTEVTVTYNFPTENSWQWVLLLNYSKNRGFLNNRLVPFPGVSYLYSPELKLLFGFPFLQIDWAPLVDLNILATATPTGVLVNSSYIYSDSLLWIFNAGVTTRSYLHTHRLNAAKRVTYEETFVEFGFKRILSPRVHFGLKAGASFNRSIYESKQVFQPEGSAHAITGDFTGGVFLEILP